jgi:glutamyl-tRNA synthetase
MKNSTPTSVVSRFAPSPTGMLHGGNYRTAVFAYLFARAHAGRFIVRIEDTDTARSKKEYEENILDALAWLGLEHDALYHQSSHVKRHEELLHMLVEKGSAYVSTEAPKDPGGRTEVIRFKNPHTSITFTDVIRGPITVDTTDLGDFVIARSFTEPVFHFAVVVDDADAGVTHVIRGEDHISNTPRQILIMEALGFARPVYAHLPLVLGSDRTKLSKRKGARAVTEYRDMGYLPEAIVNYLAMVGWNPGTDQELFTKEELVAAFSLEKIQSSPGVFDEEKLRWINKQHMQRLSDDAFIDILKNRHPSNSLIDAIGASAAALADLRERLHTFGELTDMLAHGELDFYRTRPTPNTAALLWKKEPSPQITQSHLRAVCESWSALAETDFTAEKLKTAIWEYAESNGRGNVLWPTRVALSGLDRSPDPFTIAECIGKAETIIRLTSACTILQSA